MPVLVRGFEKGLDEQAGRVVHPDVDSSEPLDRGLGQVVDRLWIPRVADEHHGVPAGLLDGRLGLTSLLERHSRDIRSSPGERLGDRAADSARGAGHDGAVAGQVEGGGRHSSEMSSCLDMSTLTRRPGRCNPRPGGS